MLGKLCIPLSFSMLAIASVACAGASTPAPEGAATMATASTTTTPTAPAPTLDSPIIGAAATAAQAPDASIRPFQFHATDAQLSDLKQRILGTRWPEKETVSDTSQGVPLATMQELARYWATDYDWRKAEAKLNSYPQFVTNIDGLDIHFVHVKSKEKNALPVVISHGWPGSVLEQIKLIDRLTDPTQHGGTAADAFDVVIPSMPGYGFSGKPTAPGWGVEHMARAWDVLMKRLGYHRYVAQAAIGGLSWSTIWACKLLPDCSPSTTTCLALFQRISTRPPSPAIHRRPASQLRRSGPTKDSPSPIST
jgi:hypothetical protein